MGDDDNGDNVLTNWSCCNDEQTLFLLLYIAYVVLALLTWKTIVAKPIRLIAVFIHEWCHAIACWMTCGDVHRINVFENEGGGICVDYFTRSYSFLVCEAIFILYPFH